MILFSVWWYHGLQLWYAQPTTLAAAIILHNDILRCCDPKAMVSSWAGCGEPKAVCVDFLHWDSLHTAARRPLLSWRVWGQHVMQHLLSIQAGCISIDVRCVLRAVWRLALLCCAACERLHGFLRQFRLDTQRCLIWTKTGMTKLAFRRMLALGRQPEFLLRAIIHWPD